MKNFWFFDDNFSSSLLKNQHNQIYLKIKGLIFSREVLEFSRLTGFTLFCSPYLSGLNRLFSENNRNLLKNLRLIPFSDKSIKKEITLEILVFGIGLFVNFLGLKDFKHEKKSRYNRISFFLFPFQKRMKNLVQREFHLLSFDLVIFPLFILSKSIIQESFFFLFQTNPFCLWWIIQMIFSVRSFKKPENRYGLTWIFLHFNSELFVPKKKKEKIGVKKGTFLENQWNLCLYQISFPMVSDWFYEIFLKCKFLLKKKKIELLRRSMVYSKYKINYIGFKSFSFFSRKRFLPRISFFNEVFGEFFCRGEYQKKKTEFKLKKDHGIFIKKVQNRSNRSGNLFEIINNRKLRRFPKFLENWSSERLLSYRPRIPGYLFHKTINYKKIFGLYSKINFMILENFIDSKSNYWLNFLDDIIKADLFPGVSTKVLIFSFISLDKIRDSIGEKKMELMAAKIELIMETFFVRKKKNLLIKSFIFSINDFLLLDFLKILDFLKEMYSKNFFTLYQQKEGKINHKTSFLCYIKERKNSSFSEASIRKKSNYNLLEKIKIILLIFGRISNEGKYFEIAAKFFLEKDYRPKYYLSVLFYKKEKFSFSEKQLNLLLENTIPNDKIYFFSGLISKEKQNFWESVKFFSLVIKDHPFNQKVWGHLSEILLKVPLMEDRILFSFTKLIRCQRFSSKLLEKVLIILLKTNRHNLEYTLEIINLIFSKNPKKPCFSNRFFEKFFNLFSDVLGKKKGKIFFSKIDNLQVPKFFLFFGENPNFFKKFSYSREEFGILKIFNQKQEFHSPSLDREVEKIDKSRRQNRELEILSKIFSKLDDNFFKN